MALFTGCGTALITPFRNGEIDYPALDHLVETQLEAGVDALIAAGTTGEPATMTWEEHLNVIRRVVEVTKCDIIGHFDRLTKFAERDPWFDACHPRYEAAWKRAADILLKTGKPFEVNTGAISRGYRTDAYPSREIRQYLRAKGARLILSSDAHGKENVGFAFDRFRDEIRGCGPESIVI